MLVGRRRSVANVEARAGETGPMHDRVGARVHFEYALAKRAMDLGLGVAGLLLSIPILILLAVIIRLDSPGPIMFRQIRVGRDGRPFNFYKFRTMHADARRRFPHLYAYRYTAEEIETMRFKVLEDPRLTRVGKHLRKTSLDELPNFINVLRGEMSIVGPRPELPEMIAYYRPSQMAKFSVRPGVTGLAQVRGRGVLRFQDTIAADLEYVRRANFWLDLQILARTAAVVVRRVGAF
jgi:lipopolysaccharide/colanic/teichoic acid biosynthesis glycosyltransferase